MKKLLRFSTATILLLVSFLVNLSADWPCRTDTAVGIATSSGSKWNVRVVSDRNNGAILVWQDRRGGLTDKLYVQRMSSNGLPIWQGEGIRLAGTGGFQYFPEMISDGAGGAYIVWQDNRSGIDYDIFIQRVDGGGASLLSQDGKVICNAVGHQYYPQITAVTAGGVIVAWQDKRSGKCDIVAQKMDAAGNLLWPENDSTGHSVSRDTSDQVNPKLVSDGTGGAIVAWEDYRSGSGSTDIYCQRILGNGQIAWPADVPICAMPNAQRNVQIVSDGAGGAIIIWQDRRSGSYENIYAQRIDPLGKIKWSPDGIALAPASGNQYYPRMIADGKGGAVIVWEDNRKGTDYDIYAQYISPDGSRNWISTGIAVCNASGHQYNPQMASQGSNFIVSWEDKRFNDYDIYAQRMNLSGHSFWAANGNPVSTASGDQITPSLASDSLQGAVIAWADYHLNNGSTAVFSQRIGANGLPAGGCFRTFDQASLGQKSVRYRLNKKLVGSPNAGNVRDSIFGRGALPYGLIIGIERRDSARRYGWEFFSRSVNCRWVLPQSGTPRPFDRFLYTKFVGRLTNPSKARYDNILAGELMVLKLNILASDVGLTQEHLGDLIFRDTAAGYNPLNNKQLRQLTASVDSMLTIWRNFTNLDYQQVFRTVSRINHAFYGPFDTISTMPLRIKNQNTLFSVPFLGPNPDQPAEMLEFQAQVVDPTDPDRITLLQNYPNPFNPWTTIEFVLPEPAVVTLTVYNVLGQQMSVPLDHVTMDDDHHFVDFDASNLSTGVYFYQLIADPVSGGKLISQVKKMMVLK